MAEVKLPKDLEDRFGLEENIPANHPYWETVHRSRPIRDDEIPTKVSGSSKTPAVSNIPDYPSTLKRSEGFSTFVSPAKSATELLKDIQGKKYEPKK